MSARPSPEAQPDGDIHCVARPHGTVAPFRRSASPYFFWRQKLGGFGRQNSGAMRRENGGARAIRPRDAGEGDHAEGAAGRPRPSGPGAGGGGAPRRGGGGGRRTRSFVVGAKKILS